jgi:hypothetical protein
MTMTDFRSTIDQAMAALALAKQQLDDEIRDYPTPIAGCDAQFNYLLEEQRKVAKAMAALKSDVFIPTPRQLTPLATA